MEFLAALFLLFSALVVAGWVVSLLARKHVYVLTTLSPKSAAEVCERKFSGLAWRRVDGRGDLNYRARGLAVGGATPPVMSISIGKADESGLTAVEFWMSEWTTRYGMVNHIEKVFWKRWSIPKALREAESVTTGTAAPDTVAPTGAQRITATQSVPQSDSGRKHAADDATVTLPDPGKPESDLKQLGYQLLQTCGLTYLTWGPLHIEQLQQAVLREIPTMRNACVNPVGSGIQGSPEDPDGMWMAYDGPQGSVLAYHALQSNDFVLNEIAMRLPLIASPAKWGIATVGAKVPVGVADILTSARAVPIWELSAFSDQRSDEKSSIPADLVLGLVTRGWTQINSRDGFRIDVPLRHGGSQAVFFTPYDTQSFALVAPVGKSEHGSIPDSVRCRTFRHYRLEVVANTVALCELFPASPSGPDPDTIAAAGREIALYAEEQFASTPFPQSGPSSSVPEPMTESTTHLVPQRSISPEISSPTTTSIGAFEALATPVQPSPSLPWATDKGSAHTFATDTVEGLTATNRGARPPAWLYAAAAVLVAFVIAVVVGGIAGGGEHRAKPGDTDAITQSRASGNSSDEDRTDVGTKDALSPQITQVSPKSLNVSIPMSHPLCDGSGIVVLANAVTPGRYDTEIQDYLDAYPGASYLRTDESCSSLRARDDAGNPIYAVYRPAGRSQPEVCAVVRAAGGNAYGKWLDTTSDPRDMITC